MVFTDIAIVRFRSLERTRATAYAVRAMVQRRCNHERAGVARSASPLYTYVRVPAWAFLTPVKSHAPRFIAAARAILIRRSLTHGDYEYFAIHARTYPATIPDDLVVPRARPFARRSTAARSQIRKLAEAVHVRPLVRFRPLPAFYSFTTSKSLSIARRRVGLPMAPLMRDPDYDNRATRFKFQGALCRPSRKSCRACSLLV